MNTPFTLDHLKHFEAELTSPAQVRLLQYFAKRCATLHETRVFPNLPDTVRLKVDPLYLAHEIGVYDFTTLIKVELFGSPLIQSQADKDRAARRRVWGCIRSGEKFVQFNAPDEQGARHAMVWFHLGVTYHATAPTTPDHIAVITVGINADFVDAMVEYGRVLIEAEEAEESGATP